MSRGSRQVASSLVRDLQAIQNFNSRAFHAPAPTKFSGFGQTRSKYRAIACKVDGFHFDSRFEAEVYGLLKMLQLAKEVLYFLRQVPFHLPGNVTYRVDYQVFFTDGRIRYLDPKGVETAAFKRSRKQVEALYPVKIETLRKLKGRVVGL